MHALAQCYLEMDIRYKYEPDRVALMRDPIPERVIPDATPVELYNIEADPQEQNNVVNDYPKRVWDMSRALETWFEDVETERLTLPVMR